MSEINEQKEKNISVQMMGEFVISVDGVEIPSLVNRTRKGVSLIEFLVLNKGKTIPRQRLINVLWSGMQNTNPESALKTLVSRLRKLMDEGCEGLGNCIVAGNGGYRWESLPGMEIDIFEIMEIFDRLAREQDTNKKLSMYKRLMTLYRNDLFLTGDIDGGSAYEAALHNEYLNAVYEYVELLMKREEYIRIVDVCKKALKIDEFDERLHMEMMQAQVLSNRIEDAMEQYRRVTDKTRKYLEVDPSEEMQSFYQRMLRSGDSLKISLDTVREDLQTGLPKTGAFVCDYQTFSQIFSIMKPTLERLSCTMFLGLIMLHDNKEQETEKKDGVRLEEAVKCLLEILQVNLRRGDVVMRYTDSIVAVLLPTVNHTTGNMVMERIRHLFFEHEEFARIPFHYRLGELADTGEPYLMQG